jgi:hypothetical protein
LALVGEIDSNRQQGYQVGYSQAKELFGEIVPARRRSKRAGKK